MRPARILVVDDNRVNRKLLVGILESLGHRVDEAGSGREAVDGVRLFAYDLVLMDVQMPGVDGIAAAASIRSLGGDRGAVPIVGVTGDVGEEMVARCRAVGMNDQLSKPVGLDALRHAVERWGGVASSPGPAGATQGGLAGAVPPDTLGALLGEFEREAGRRVAELEEVVRTGERRRARAIAHDLGGAAANLGFPELSRIARAIEIACDDGGDPGELARMIGELPEILLGTVAAAAGHRTRLAVAGREDMRDSRWRKA